MVPVSGIKPKAITRDGMISRHGGKVRGRREYVYTPERPSAVFLLGCPHHRNGDCGCEPAHLNVVLGWMLSPCTECRNPATVAQWRGFCCCHSPAILRESVPPR